MNVYTTKDYYNIPKGSYIRDVKEVGPDHYKGVWSSMFGTWPVLIRKDHCKKEEN